MFISEREVTQARDGGLISSCFSKRRDLNSESVTVASGSLRENFSPKDRKTVSFPHSISPNHM